MPVDFSDLIYLVFIEQLCLEFGKFFLPDLAQYIFDDASIFIGTGSLIAVYSFNLLLGIELLKLLVWQIISTEVKEQLIKWKNGYPDLNFFIESMSVLSSHIIGIYLVSHMLNVAFWPLLTCMLCGSMSLLFIGLSLICVIYSLTQSLNTAPSPPLPEFQTFNENDLVRPW